MSPHKKVLAPLNKLEQILLLLLAYIVLAAITAIIYQGYTMVTKEVPLKGGSYTEGLIGRVLYLNPVLAHFNNADQEITSLLFSGLLRLDPITGDPLPDIAISIETNEEGDSYIITLDPNRTWHDGTPVTSKDVLFTYQQILQDPSYNGPLKGAFSNIEILSESDHKVTIQTSETNIFFLNLLSTGLLPAHKFPEDADFHDISLDSFNKAPLGNGPFKFVSLKSYRDHDQVVLKPLVETKISELVFKTFSSFDDLLRNKNSLNGISEIPKSKLSELPDDDWIIHHLRLPRYVVLFFDNLSSGPTSSNKVRLGIKFALNKKDLVNVAEKAEVLNFPIETLNSQTIVQDKSKSASLLYGAGWGVYSKYNDNIRRNSAGKELKLTLATTENPELINVAEEIKSQLKELGIIIDILPMNLADLNNDVLRNRDYSMLLFGQSIGTNEDFYPFLHSSQISEPGLNISQYKDINTDVLLERIRTSLNPEKRLSLLKDLQERLNSDVPLVFLYRPYYLYATSSHLGELEFPQNLRQTTDRFAYLPKWHANFKRIWSLKEYK